MVRRAPLVLAALSVSVSVVACAAFSGGSEDEPAGEGDGSAPDVAATPLVDASDLPEQPVPDAALCERGRVVDVFATADIALYPSENNFFCFGTANPGLADHATLKVDYLSVDNVPLPSFAIFRFALSADQLAAVKAPQDVLRSVELVLARAAVCNGGACTGDSFVADGRLHASPLRLDWDELSATDSDHGADYCRRRLSRQGRSDDAAWGMDGAQGPQDVGREAGSADVDLVQDHVAIPLDPSEWGESWLGDGSADNFAVRVAPAAGARFVVATKEYAAPTPVPSKPTLRLTYCK